VFRLLAALGESCPAQILDDLYAAAAKAEPTDLTAIREYIVAHRKRLHSMTPRERFLLSRVEGLERLLSS